MNLIMPALQRCFGAQYEPEVFLFGARAWKQFEYECEQTGMIQVTEPPKGMKFEVTFCGVPCVHMRNAKHPDAVEMHGRAYDGFAVILTVQP